ncbi:MAG: reductive dehalogenase [Alphaproteobacteria bacterium]|nr:reductive dehalogenase [Alphaproteobacteria bacterium]
MSERATSPDGWPANKPVDNKADWKRFEASDKAAGFEISDDFERFDQRNDMFNRAFWDDEVITDHVTAFFQAYIHPKPRKADGFTQWDYALLNASWSVSNEFSARGGKTGVREGFLDPFKKFTPLAPTKVDIDDPEKAASRLKKVAEFFGADAFGITEYDERFAYASMADVRTNEREEKFNPVTEGMTSVIIVGHGMDFGLVRSYPSALGASATGREYSREAAVATSIASFIQGLGYNTIASSNDSALTIPYAIKAGLGEYGRNQMVITPGHGPRIRFSKIFTDMPLAHNKPIKSGVTETCNVCQKCADACPPKALPYGPPKEGGENRSTIKGVKKWSANCEKCFSYWTKMRADCAICMRVCPYNKDFSKWYMRLFRDLLNSPLRKVMLWLDDKLKFDARKPPHEWWGDTPAP